MYAEDVNYWKTGRSDVDTWIERAKKEIRAVAGVVHGSGSYTDDATGRGVIFIRFSFGNDEFNLKWVVLESKAGDIAAARRQAATALYHDVKAACVKLKFFGARAAFLPYLLLPDGSGKNLMEASGTDMIKLLPALS